jgi:hypothetical protein
MLSRRKMTERKGSTSDATVLFAVGATVGGVVDSLSAVGDGLLVGSAVTVMTAVSVESGVRVVFGSRVEMLAAVGLETSAGVIDGSSTMQPIVWQVNRNTMTNKPER